MDEPFGALDALTRRSAQRCPRPRSGSHRAHHRVRHPRHRRGDPARRHGVRDEPATRPRARGRRDRHPAAGAASRCASARFIELCTGRCTDLRTLSAPAPPCRSFGPMSPTGRSAGRSPPQRLEHCDPSVGVVLRQSASSRPNRWSRDPGFGGVVSLRGEHDFATIERTSAPSRRRTRTCRSTSPRAGFIYSTVIGVYLDAGPPACAPEVVLFKLVAPPRNTTVLTNRRSRATRDPERCMSAGRTMQTCLSIRTPGGLGV